jgi:hypothetical protein
MQKHAGSTSLVGQLLTAHPCRAGIAEGRGLQPAAQKGATEGEWERASRGEGRGGVSWALSIPGGRGSNQGEKVREPGRKVWAVQGEG